VRAHVLGQVVAACSSVGTVRNLARVNFLFYVRRLVAELVDLVAMVVVVSYKW
jgi:hypothetical protein